MAVRYTNQSTTAYAWQLARDYAATHGGKAKDYFGVSMKAAQKEVWNTIAANDIEDILNYLDLQLQLVSTKMRGYVEKAENVLISLITGAISDAEDRGEKNPQMWVRDKLAEYFGGTSKIKDKMRDIELAIYHGSGYSKEEQGLPAFKRTIAELEQILKTTAMGKWW